MTTGYRHGADCFEIISFAGGSTDGKVYNVQHKDTGESLSMHVIPKTNKDQGQCSSYLAVETFRIPFAVNLRYSFQTKSRSYHILDTLKEDRKLSLFLKAHGSFKASEVVFVIAEVLLAVSQLHAYCKVYGFIDLDHVYFDITGHVRLKRDVTEAHYWLPNECVRCRQAGVCSYHKGGSARQEAIAKDWADVGSLMSLLFGYTEDGVGITHGKKIVQSCLPEDASDLLAALLNWRTSPFTAGELQDHAFFREVNWQRAQKRQLTPPEVFIRTPTQDSLGLHDIRQRYDISRQEIQSDNTRLNENIQLWKRSQFDSRGTRHDLSFSNQLRIRNQQSIGDQSINDQSVHGQSQKAFILANRSTSLPTKQETAAAKDDRISKLTHNHNGSSDGNLDTYVDFASHSPSIEKTFLPSTLNNSTVTTDFSYSVQQCSSARQNDFRKCDKPNLHEAEYNFDNITFVTVESLDKSFREKSQQSKRNSPSEAIEGSMAGMSYKDIRGQYLDLSDAQSNGYQQCSTSISIDQRQQPGLSKSYSSPENILPSTHRYIMGYSRPLTDESVNDKLMQFSNSVRNERSAFQTSRQHTALDTSALLYTDINDNTSPISYYEGGFSIPGFTRSNSYNGGFPISSLDQKEVVKHSSDFVEKAGDVTSAYRANGDASFNDGFVIPRPDYAPRELDETILDSNVGERYRISDCSSVSLSPLDKASSPLSSVNSQESSFQRGGLNRLQRDLSANELQYSNQKIPPRPCSDDKLLTDYLNRSFPLEQKPYAEENSLRRTWPAGLNFPTPSFSVNTPERKQPSLIHRISDNDALQIIRQGAYLQARRDFTVPLKYDFNQPKKELCDGSCSSLERDNARRLSRSLDNEVLSIGEGKSFFRAVDAATTLRGTASANDLTSRKSRHEEQIFDTTSRPYSPRKAMVAYEKSDKLGFEERVNFDRLNCSTSQPASTAGYSTKPSTRNYSEAGDSIRVSYLPTEMRDKIISEESCSFEQSAVEYQGDQRKTGPEQIDKSISAKCSLGDSDMTSATLQPRDREVVVTENVIEPVVGDDDVFLANEDYSCELVQEKRMVEGEEKLGNRLKVSTVDMSSSTVKSKDSRKGSRKGKARRTSSDKQKLRKCRSTEHLPDGGLPSDGLNARLDDENMKSRKKMQRVAKARSVDCESMEVKLEESAVIKRRLKREKSNDDSSRQCKKCQITENENSNCENELDEKDKEDTESKPGKITTRSVSFHETTKYPGGSVKSPVTRKTQSAGAVDSQRLKLSLGKSMKKKELNIEILPNPKSHHKNHRRLRSAEDERTLKNTEEVRNSPRKMSVDSTVSQHSDDGIGVTYLVDRLRVISESGRSLRTSPSTDRRSLRNSPSFDSRRKSPENDNDLVSSNTKIVKPTITVQNSSPRSASPVSSEKDAYEGQRKTSGGFFISRESSIGSASDLWLDEEEMNSFGKRGISCRRSASTSSAKSVESIEYLRARYSKSPTLTVNSSEEEINTRDADKESCNSNRSIDSGLSDVFGTIKDDDHPLHVSRGKTNAVSKSDSGVVKDINGNRTSESDQDITEAKETSLEADTMCLRCSIGHTEQNISKDEIIEICKKCHKKQIERKEAIVELIQTEINYGQDLRILKEEFYAPIKNGGILSTDNVNAVFLNLQELIDVNSKLCITLQDDLEECITRDDQELESLQVGRVFLENVEFFQAYEVFCTKQRQASELVESLQKKSELLRIFLQVSCKQNSKLRKMDLKSFLTMPVQRIMKYPLLLTRIYRVTPRQNSDREALIQARRKIEEQITKINEIASGRPAKLRKCKSTSALNQTQPKGNHLIRLVAEILDWKLEETQLVLSDAFEVSCGELINVANWSRKSMKKPCKVQTILCLYGVLEQLHMDTIGGQCGTGSRCDATNAAVIILKKKSTHRYSLFKKFSLLCNFINGVKTLSLLEKMESFCKCEHYRIQAQQEEPIMLSQAVISERRDVKIAFEILPISKEPLTFITDDPMCCQKWLRSLRYYARDLGIWRVRRNAMANIMIQSMS